MPAPQLLADIVILLVVAIAVLYVSQGFRIPATVAFLISGVLVGPHGLGLVHGVEEVEQLAEIGVVLLLFTIGLEFSLAELVRMRRLVLVGGALQILGVTAAVSLGLAAAGMALGQAAFFGMLASLSSTAVVLTLLQDRAELDAPHGRASLAILVFQDVMIVPMILLVPVLSGASADLAGALGTFAGKTISVLVILAMSARFVVPQLLDRVVRRRSRDLFLLTVVTICLAVAWTSYLAGLSLALGAFLAGLLISESEYSQQALADILPFRDLFAAFFFVSIGMLLDLRLVVSEPLVLGTLLIGVLTVKALAAGLATIVLGSSVGAGVKTGFGMSQVGEFSFVLAGVGLAAGLVTERGYQWFVAVAVVSIGVTPLMFGLSDWAAGVLDGLPLSDRLRTGGVPRGGSVAETELTDHVVVIGYGVNGRNVVRASRIAGIPYVAVDMNPALVSEARAADVDIRYGDATRQSFLEYLDVQKARVVVVAISDAAATRRITALVRDLNPGCSIVTRTRYVREVEALQRLGATTVIPEELETSIEIVSRILTSYLIPRREIDTFVSEIRAKGYQILRSPPGAGANLDDLRQTLTDIGVTTLRVGSGSGIAGQRLAETDLRRLYGLTVVAIRRGDGLISNPGGREMVEAGDLLVVLGRGQEISAAAELITAPD